MSEVIAVKFKDNGKAYYFSPAGYFVKKGQSVIVETARGIEYGFCTEGNKTVDDSCIVKPLKGIIRVATQKDSTQYRENIEKADAALKICREKVLMHKLDMNLVEAEYSFDRAKLTFFYTAPDRVDFRELVKTLASAFHTRIELRQIGIRDKARMVGGLGICGLPLCCKSQVVNFQPVTIKMAKEQGLSLSLPKISGTCGRLMCCLKYEQDSYSHLLSITPKVGAYVGTPEGKGTVVSNNLLTGMLKISLEKAPTATPVSYHRNDVQLIRDGKISVNKEEMAELDEAIDKD